MPSLSLTVTASSALLAVSRRPHSHQRRRCGPRFFSPLRVQPRKKSGWRGTPTPVSKTCSKYLLASSAKGQGSTFTKLPGMLKLSGYWHAGRSQDDHARRPTQRGVTLPCTCSPVISVPGAIGWRVQRRQAHHAAAMNTAHSTAMMTMAPISPLLASPSLDQVMPWVSWVEARKAYWLQGREAGSQACLYAGAVEEDGAGHKNYTLAHAAASGAGAKSCWHPSRGRARSAQCWSQAVALGSPSLNGTHARLA